MHVLCIVIMYSTHNLCKMYWLYLFFVGGLIISFLLYYFKKVNSFWITRGIPGPKPELLFGNIKQAALRNEHIAEVFKNIYDEFPNECLVGIYRMTSPCILLRDLNVIKHVMIKDFDTFEDRGIELSKEGLGANLFHADGDTWRVLRNRFSPLFTSAKLRNMVYSVNERCDYLMKHLDEITSVDSDIEVSMEFKKYSISTIAVCIFGLELNLFEDSLMKILLKLDKPTLTFNIFYELDMMFPSLLKKINSCIFPADIQNFYKHIVKESIAKRNGVPSGRNDFIDLILAMRQEGSIKLKDENEYNVSKDSNLEVTESMIAAQIFIFFIAGYDTSATVLSLLLFEIANNLEIQEKLILEIDAVLHKCNGNISYDTLRDAPYVEKVFKEIHRKYPPVPLQRKAKTDYKVPGTEYTIEKGTIVMVSSLGIHMDKNYYPDPEKFDPERFSTENTKNRHPCSYLPYGIGPRNCIGILFGKLQTRMFLMKFLSKYRVELSPKTKSIVIDPNRIGLSPLNGIHVNIIPRKIKGM